MAKRRRYRQGASRPRQIRPGSVLLLLLFALLLCALFLYLRMRPMVESAVTYQAKVLANRIVNQALLEELDESGISYDDLVHLQRGSDGRVTSVQSDMVEISRLKSRMSQRIVEGLHDGEKQSIHLPVGTLFGNEFLAGRGPSIAVEVVPIGYVQTDIYNSFSSAGINQTHHQVMLTATVEMLVLLPGYKIEVETVTGFCVAETVIVGELPDTVLQFGEDSAPALTKIKS